MPARIGVKSRPHLLVLESVWSDNLADYTSVRPFMEGWGKAAGVRVGFRSYHDSRDLTYWLRRFVTAVGTPKICYIAGHGSGKRLDGVGQAGNIHIVKALEKAIPPRPGPRPRVGVKGVLVGACEVGSESHRRQILENTGKSLSWIAGYDHEVPWIEATTCDLLFLTYLIQGRCRREHLEDGSLRFLEKDRRFLVDSTRKAEKAARWVREDLSLAVACGFGATDRYPGR